MLEQQQCVADTPLLHQMNNRLLQFQGGRVVDAAEKKHIDYTQLHGFILRETGWGVSSRTGGEGSAPAVAYEDNSWPLRLAQPTPRSAPDVTFLPPRPSACPRGAIPFPGTQQ